MVIALLLTQASNVKLAVPPNDKLALFPTLSNTTISLTPSKFKALSVFTVAVNVFEAAPVDVIEKTPLIADVDELTSLAKTFVEDKVPDDGVKVKVEL